MFGFFWSHSQYITFHWLNSVKVFFFFFKSKSKTLPKFPAACHRLQSETPANRQTKIENESEIKKQRCYVKLIISPGWFSAPGASSIWSESSNRRLDKEQRKHHETQSQQRRKIPFGNLHLFRSLKRAAYLMGDTTWADLNISTLVVSFVSLWPSWYSSNMWGGFHFDVRFFWVSFTPVQAALCWTRPSASLSSKPRPFYFLIKRKLGEFSQTWDEVSIQHAAHLPLICN